MRILSAACLLTLSVTLAAIAACSSNVGGSGSGGGGEGGEGGSGAASTSGSGGAGGAGVQCFDYSAWDGSAPAVSFQTDVLPIFRTACGLSAACHGDPNGPVSQPYLGPPNSAGQATPENIAAIFADIVGVQAAQGAGMAIVEPGKPQESFLMHKTDGTLACEPVACGIKCGGSMPLGSIPLPKDKRDTVRRWIAQGALNN
jgi:hypothetical protein